MGRVETYNSLIDLMSLVTKAPCGPHAVKSTLVEHQLGLHGLEGCHGLGVHGFSWKIIHAVLLYKLKGPCRGVNQRPPITK